MLKKFGDRHAKALTVGGVLLLAAVIAAWVITAVRTDAPAKKPRGVGPGRRSPVARIPARAVWWAPWRSQCHRAEFGAPGHLCAARILALFPGGAPYPRRGTARRLVSATFTADTGEW